MGNGKHRIMAIDPPDLVPKSTPSNLGDHESMFSKLSCHDR